MMRANGPRGPGENELLDALQTGQKKRDNNNNRNNNNKPHFPYITHTSHDAHTTKDIHTRSCGCTQPTRTKPIHDTHNQDYNRQGIKDCTEIKAAGDERAQKNTEGPGDITATKKTRDIRKPGRSETKVAREEERGRNNPDTCQDGSDTTGRPPDGTTADKDLREIPPGGIKTIKDLSDIPSFHDRFLQHLGDRHRWVLYRVSFSQSPEQLSDTACDRTWTKNDPQGIARLDREVYRLLQKAFQDFAPARPIFQRHQEEHPFCASRVWFSLRDRFKLQLGRAREQMLTTALRQQLTELTKTCNGIPHPPTPASTRQRTSAKKAPQVDSTNTSPRTAHTRHTAQDKARPHHQQPHTVTVTDKRHSGVNRNKPTFKERTERFTDRPSKRHCHTHTYTLPQSPMPKRSSTPCGRKSKGNRVDKSDGLIPDPIHPLGSPHPPGTSRPKITLGCPLLRGGGKVKEGHTKKNTMRVPQKRDTHTSKLGEPSKRVTAAKDPLTEEEPEFPDPIIIDARTHKKERLAPVHFIKSSRNPAHIKRKLSWWDLAIDTHASKTRLSRRWTYILNRRQHRQPAELQQSWHRHTDQIRTTRGEYLGTRVDYSWEGIHGYTTPLPTLPPDIIEGQLNNNRFTIIAQPNSTVAYLKTALGRHFKMNVDSFYVTANGSPRTDSERARSGTPIRMIPRLRGGTGPKRRSTRPPALDFLTELAGVRRLLHQNMSQHSPQDLIVKTLADEGGQSVLIELQQLTQRTKSSNHPRYEQMRESCDRARIQSIDNTWAALRSIHCDSVPCPANSNSTPRLFCPQQCRHTTITGEPCPNQIPTALRTGTGIGTTTKTSFDLDLAANYLVAKDLIPAGTLFSVFGGAAIIRENSKPGRELRETYSHIQNSQTDRKCQYTFRASTGSPDEIYWVLPTPDIETISGHGISGSLRGALQQRSPLIGSGHIAQHSCCTNTTCSTSTNARLGLILEASNNDNDDICLGAGLTATRAIQPGEQVYVSYAGDGNIADAWEDIFKTKCYCCACRGECMTTATTRHMETDDTKNMEIEGPPLQRQQRPSGPTSLHRLDSHDQSHKKARQHPQESPNYASPKERATLVDHEYHVRDIMQDLNAAPPNTHPTIVNSFDIPISRRAFSSMAGGKYLNDDIINWTLAWWRSQIGGGQNNNKTITPQVHPDLPRCYYANTHWFTKLQEAGATERLLRWTNKANLDRDYDLMLIPVNILEHHWYLAVIDFKNKRIATHDSYEPKRTRNTIAPAKPETYSTLITWLTKHHGETYKSRFPAEEWQHVSSYTCMGHTPQQGTPSDAGVDCGFFTLAFAMEISLGRTQFGFGQEDIPGIRNWIAHTMVSHGKQNDTYDLPRLPTHKDGGQQPNKRRMTGEGGSKQKVRKQELTWRIPGAPPPRGITNSGGRCAINVAMQLYFHIPSITHIPGLQQIQALQSNLDKYVSGNGPLTLDNLQSIFPQSDKTGTQDVGEILTLIFDRLSTPTPKEQERLPLITLIDPGTSIYSSLQNCQTWNLSQGDGDKTTLIFQINRVTMKGQKVTNRTTYPKALDLQRCQPLRGQKTGTHHGLKAVVVHKGSSVGKGHYVVYIQPSHGKSWALFDDQTVKWVQEEEVLAQEASLLIYARQPPPTLFNASTADQRTTNTTVSSNTTTSLQRHGRDNTESGPPGSREMHPDHPVSAPPPREGKEQHQLRKIPASTPHTPTEKIDQAGRQRGLQKFQDALRRKLARSPTEWTPLSTITQWLSGRNRQRPCTILSDLDAHQIQTWIGQEQDIASYIKSCDFIHWQQEINDVFLALRPSTTTPTAQPYRNQPTSLREPREEGRRIIVPPSIDLPAAQKKRTSIKNCPTVASWEEATEARLNLLDYLVQQRNSISQEKRDPSDQEKWLEQRLRHQVKGILRDISPSAPLPEQLYYQGRRWFQDNKVGQFLDNLNNLARKPEFQRTSNTASIRICISNTSARSKQILLSRVKNTGITILREDQAEFDIKFSGKSRIQSASLEMEVQVDKKLMDLLQGTTHLEGIGGRATVTQINNDTEALHHMELKPNKQKDRRGLPLLANIWSTIGASESQILTWILLCTSTQPTWVAESAILSSPDGPASLPTIWGTKEQRSHRGHILLQSTSPTTPTQSRDTLAAVSSIAGDNRLHTSSGLEDTLTPPRKPVNTPRLVTRVGLPHKDGEASWISDNQLLQHHLELASEAFDIISSAPEWLRQCAIHVRLDPVLGRCSWEEQSSICIRLKQTHNTASTTIDRSLMRLSICTMLNTLQNQCWPENEPFDIAEVEFMGYHANSTSKHKRLEGMITIEYRPKIPLEQDLLVGLLLAMHIGNDIPKGQEGCGFKWCPIRNELGETTCTVTKVTTRRTTKGHCRQEIPMGEYNRNRQHWSLKDKTKETLYLLKMAARGDDSSLAVLNKIRTRKWNSTPPNPRATRAKQGTPAETWQGIPTSPSSTPPPSPRHLPTDIPDWQKLIWTATRRPQPENDLETSEMEETPAPPPPGQGEPARST